MTEERIKEVVDKIREKQSNEEILKIVKEDLEYGLSVENVENYAYSEMSADRCRLISTMYRKGYSVRAIGDIGNPDLSIDKIEIGMELYDKNIPLAQIKDILHSNQTREQILEQFSNVLSNVQETLTISENEVKESIEEDKDIPKYVDSLMKQLQDVANKISFQDERYDTLNQVLKKMEVAAEDSILAKKLTEKNGELETQNRELSEELGRKQDAVTKGMQTIAQLRVQNEDRDKMISQLKDQNESSDRKIKELEAKVKELEDESKKDTKNQVNPFLARQEEIKLNNTAQNMEKESLQKAFETGNGVPIFYQVVISDKNGRSMVSELEYTKPKKRKLEGFISKFSMKKKYQKNFFGMIVKKELSVEQIGEIKVALEKGLTDEQLEMIIKKELTPERIRGIVEFAVVQNKIDAERRAKS